MAKTAVFTAEGELLGFAKSIKEAKILRPNWKEAKLEFMTEKDFEPFGGYETKEQLFGTKPERKPRTPKEPQVDADGNPFAAVARKRSGNIKLTGAYVVVKANGVRTDNDRAAVHAALLQEPHTFEAFLARAPEKFTFTTNRGRETTESSSVWARYALRRGWIKVVSGDEQPVPQEDKVEEVPAEQEAVVADDTTTSDSPAYGY